MEPSRRRFLVLFAGLPGVAGCSRLRSKSSSEVDGELLGRHLISALSDFSSAQIIGRRYFGSLKQKPNRGRVAVVLADRLSRNAESVMKLDRVALQDRIHSQCQEDYLTGQTVELRGWLLPRTEVELCLLAMLFDDPGNPRN